MSRRLLHAFIAAATLLPALTAAATESAETAKKEIGLGLPPVADSLTGDLLRMLWGLSIVIALLLAVSWLVRRKFALPGAGGTSAITVVEMRPLTGRKALALVEVEGRRVLLGIAEQQITSLATFEPATSFAETLRSREAELTQPAEEEAQ